MEHTKSNNDQTKLAKRLPSLPTLRLLMIADGRIASTAIMNTIFSGLNDQGAIEFHCLYTNESTLSDRKDAVKWSDIVFFFRSSFPPTVSLLRLARDLGKGTIYSTDDDFLLLDKDSPLGKIHQSPENIAAYQAMFREADLVWLFTDEMVGRYHSLNPRIVLGKLPSPLELYPSISNLSVDDGQTFTIGYAGRFIHEQDLEVLVKPLIRILDSPGSNLRVEFIDCIPGSLRGHPRVRHLPYFDDITDYYAYMFQANWSIGLALLEDTPFNRCKTNNKYREYAAFGIAGIYSDMPVYSTCVNHRVNGYLAPHTEEGISQALLELLRDRDLRESIRKHALQDVSASYSLKAAQLQMLREISLLGIEKIGNRASKPRLLVIGYDKASSTHIDALQPCRYLEDVDLLSFSWREPSHVQKDDFSNAEFIYLVRAFESVNLPVLEWAQNSQIPMICSWDDDFFSIPPTTRLGKIYSKPHTKMVMEQFLRDCSLIMASTIPLVNRSKTFNPNVMEAIYGLKAPDFNGLVNPETTFPPDKIRIGFFGSNDAINESFMLETLTDLRSHYRDTITIEVIGSKPDKHLATLIDASFDIVWNYDEALTLLKSRHWDIGLAPLNDTEFNSAKQPTKFRDYAWCGAAIIASDVETYRRSLIHGIHCLLTKNTSSDWAKAIGTLIESESLRRFLTTGAARLLDGLHVQDKTIASWIQLAWRMKKYNMDKIGYSHTLAIQPKGSTSSERNVIIPSSSLFAQVLRKRLAYRAVAQYPNWHQLEIMLGTHNRKPTGSLQLRVFSEHGNLMRESRVDLSSARDNDWVQFSFQPISHSAHTSFILEFSLKDKGPGTKISLYETGSSPGNWHRVKRHLGMGSPADSLAYLMKYLPS